MTAPRLAVRHLGIRFERYAGALGRTGVDALSDVSLDVGAGELVGIVGASGSGKSLLAHAILGILPPNAVLSGSIRFNGAILDPAAIARLRGREIALVPQSVTALDPLVRVGRQITRMARLSGLDAASAADAAASAVARYGLAPSSLSLFPHALSGGMARRVLLAMATAGTARCLIADEPTVGLDPAAIAATLGDLRRLADTGYAIAVISHDLAALAAAADRIVVIEQGRTVAAEPAHAFAGTGALIASPYARALWQAVPANGMRRALCDAAPLATLNLVDA
jgi:peptide/nickel transport system ATP-binding protein